MIHSWENEKESAIKGEEGERRALQVYTLTWDKEKYHFLGLSLPPLCMHRFLLHSLSRCFTLSTLVHCASGRNKWLQDGECTWRPVREAQGEKEKERSYCQSERLKAKSSDFTGSSGIHSQADWFLLRCLAVRFHEISGVTFSPLSPLFLSPSLISHALLPLALTTLIDQTAFKFIHPFPFDRPLRPIKLATRGSAPKQLKTHVERWINIVSLSTAGGGEGREVCINSCIQMAGKEKDIFIESHCSFVSSLMRVVEAGRRVEACLTQVT